MTRVKGPATGPCLCSLAGYVASTIILGGEGDDFQMSEYGKATVFYVVHGSSVDLIHAPLQDPIHLQ